MAYRVTNEVDSGGGKANGKHGAGPGRKLDDEEERDAVFYRLESLGYRVGQGLVERCVMI